ncbi:hypothetical protein PGT21_035115 [Puccinia graminis f. sp. tritici]|uniref:Uncharacterized protein n=1 Tax=Puccinia graminis f. sp. tritici TaxID=56615 RepID=A0A5B0R810_PUCGR|nr:hypothetical protein PGT21_035115 [Puccinia graminis f. sp. tritici]KAA1121323.1 hypothetical protein PGTUg99_007740 [Puccinia graminis f. sp. tritici]
MAFFRFRNVEAVLLLLLISLSQVASFAVERRDQSDTEIKPYCEQPKIQGNPGLMAHDCAVAFYNFKYEGEHKVVRSNDGNPVLLFSSRHFFWANVVKQQTRRWIRKAPVDVHQQCKTLSGSL